MKKNFRSPTHFDTKELAKENGYSILNNSLFKYATLLDLDIADIGILCRLYSFSPGFIIKLDEAFPTMGKSQRTVRLNKLKEKNYIIVNKTNYLTKEGIRSGGVKVNLKPLSSILSYLSKAEKEGEVLEYALTEIKIQNLTDFDFPS